MSESAEGRPPLGRAESASRQLEKAVRFVAAQHGVARISLIAHSWGSMAAGLFSGRRPELVERLVFFAPIALGPPPQSRAQRYGGWQLVSLQQQWERFIEDVPAGEPPVLSRRHFEDWGPRYLATDAESGTRSPQSVKVPCGPVQEISEAQAGRLAYDPGAIRAPVAILRGEWDHLVTDCHAHWLFNALRNSALKRDIKISRGTHLLHLEAGRYALYRETQAFLDGQDQAPTTTERNNSKE
jgi:pimeloyl-ACP methyl ester carboxylesterase